MKKQKDFEKVVVRRNSVFIFSSFHFFLSSFTSLSNREIPGPFGDRVMDGCIYVRRAEVDRLWSGAESWSRGYSSLSTKLLSFMTSSSTSSLSSSFSPPTSLTSFSPHQVPTAGPTLSLWKPSSTTPSSPTLQPPPTEECIGKA